MFVAIAYRWGDNENHHYFVYAGDDKTKALALAQAEEQDRGGKYGVQVLEFNTDGTEYKQIEYFPGTSDAKHPTKNHRTDMLVSLGLAFEQAVQNGTRDRSVPDTLGNGHKIRILRRVKAVVPRWMRLIYARALRRKKTYEEIFK